MSTRTLFSPAYTNHPFVRVLTAPRIGCPIREAILQHLDAATAWSLHAVIPGGRFGAWFNSPGSKYGTDEYGALRAIAHGQAGSNVLALLRLLILRFGGKNPLSFSLLVAAMTTAWAKNISDLQLIESLVYVPKCGIDLTIISFPRDAYATISSWPASKPTLDYCLKFYQERNMHHHGTLFKLKTSLLLKRQCSFPEIMYWNGIVPNEYRHTLCELYDIAVCTYNVSVAMILWDLIPQSQRKNTVIWQTINLAHDYIVPPTSSDRKFPRAVDVYAFYQYLDTTFGPVALLSGYMFGCLLLSTGPRDAVLDENILEHVISHVSLRDVKDVFHTAIHMHSLGPFMVLAGSIRDVVPAFVTSIQCLFEKNFALLKQQSYWDALDSWKFYCRVGEIAPRLRVPVLDAMYADLLETMKPAILKRYDERVRLSARRRRRSRSCHHSPS